jgi:hypothetical protein
MDMRRARLVTFQAKVLVIHDWEALKDAAGFDANYLHLDGENPRASVLSSRNSA